MTRGEQERRAAALIRAAGPDGVDFKFLLGSMTADEAKKAMNRAWVKAGPEVHRFSQSAGHYRYRLSKYTTKSNDNELS